MPQRLSYPFLAISAVREVGHATLTYVTLPEQKRTLALLDLRRRTLFRPHGKAGTMTPVP
jgi:hypothetical protein